MQVILHKMADGRVVEPRKAIATWHRMSEILRGQYHFGESNLQIAPVGAIGGCSQF